MGDRITTAKMTLVGRLQGADPHLLAMRSGTSIKISELPHTPLKAGDVLPNETFSPQGFFYYGRDAILAADSAGLIITPLKLTSHANIYKILETYHSLSSLRGGSDGTIVAPIQKHRIQTRHQAHVGSDPCDATVLAYLSRRNPVGFQDLMEAFHSTCRVLSIEEALSVGVQDKKLVVEEYLL
ncbi:MAG: hypothetical protein UZ21_OP11001000348 [Microgenomates bacterium OLB22]|nr:MAG: hypothetical protein UZ21_OP11001000348 [Microgenomates bacterium OLB22]